VPEEVVLVLVKQIFSSVEGFFELPELCLQVSAVGARFSRFDYQIELWHDAGLQFMELIRHVNAKVG
jgi:hypothetical protein